MQRGRKQIRTIIHAHNDREGTVAERAEERERVTCGDCGQEMAAASLDSHRMSQHGRAMERKWTWTHATMGREEPKTYQMEFPKGGAKRCPAEGCPGRAGTRTAMRVHFWRRHVRNTVIILKEGNFPHPLCTLPDFRLGIPPPLLVCAAPTHFCIIVAPIKGPPRHQHVAFLASRV